MGSFSRV